MGLGPIKGQAQPLRYLPRIGPRAVAYTCDLRRANLRGLSGKRGDNRNAFETTTLALAWGQYISGAAAIELHFLVARPLSGR
jgi:hypothetical protein